MEALGLAMFKAFGIFCLWGIGSVYIAFTSGTKRAVVLKSIVLYTVLVGLVIFLANN